MDFIITLLPVALFMVLIYFLTIRPQKRRQEEHKSMIDQISKGDVVVTIGGLHGVVDEQDNNAQTIVLDCEGVYLTFEKRAIARVASKGTTVSQTTNYAVDETTEDRVDNRTTDATVEDLGSNQPTHTDEVE